MVEQNNFQALDNLTNPKPKRKKTQDTKPAKAGFNPFNPPGGTDGFFAKESEAKSYKPGSDPTKSYYENVVDMQNYELVNKNKSVRQRVREVDELDLDNDYDFKAYVTASNTFFGQINPLKPETLEETLYPKSPVPTEKDLQKIITPELKESYKANRKTKIIEQEFFDFNEETGELAPKDKNFKEISNFLPEDLEDYTFDKKDDLKLKSKNATLNALLSSKEFKDATKDFNDGFKENILPKLKNNIAEKYNLYTTEGVEKAQKELDSIYTAEFEEYVSKDQILTQKLKALDLANAKTVEDRTNIKTRIDNPVYSFLDAYKYGGAVNMVSAALAEGAFSGIVSLGGGAVNTLASLQASNLKSIERQITELEKKKKAGEKTTTVIEDSGFDSYAKVDRPIDSVINDLKKRLPQVEDAVISTMESSEYLSVISAAAKKANFEDGIDLEDFLLATGQSGPSMAITAVPFAGIPMLAYSEYGNGYMSTIRQGLIDDGKEITRENIIDALKNDTYGSKATEVAAALAGASLEKIGATKVGKALGKSLGFGSTDKMFRSIFAGDVKLWLKNNALPAAKNIVGSGAEEYATEFAQEGLSQLKLGIQLNDYKRFIDFTAMNNSGKQGLAVGLFLPSVGSAASQFRKELNFGVSKIASMADIKTGDLGNRAAGNQYFTQLKQNLKTAFAENKITKEEMEAKLQAVYETEAASSKIPKKYSLEGKQRSLDYAIRLNEIENKTKNFSKEQLVPYEDEIKEIKNGITRLAYTEKAIADIQQGKDLAGTIFGDKLSVISFSNKNELIKASETFANLLVSDEGFVKKVKDAYEKRNPDSKVTNDEILNVAKIRANSILNDMIQKDAFGIIDQAIGDSQYVFVNVVQGRKSNVSTTALHEVLHGVLLNNTKNLPDMGNALLDYLGVQYSQITNTFINTKNDTSLGKYIERLNDYAADPSKTNDVIYEEAITLLAEEIKEGRINKNNSIFDKLVRFFNNIISKLPGANKENIYKFETGKDVYNFVKDYTNVYSKKGDSSKLKAFAEGEVQNLIDGKNRMLDTRVDASGQVGVKESMKLQELLDKYDGNTRRMVNESLAKTPTGNFTVNLKNTVLGVELGGMIETITRRLYDPIPMDNKEMVSREEYKDALIGLASTMITNEYKADKQTLDQFVSSRLNLRANSLAKELGIESTQEQGGAGFKTTIDPNKTSEDGDFEFDEDLMSEEDADALLEQAEAEAAEQAAKAPRFIDTIDIDVEIDGKPLADTFNEKMERNLSFALKRYDEETSKNRTITPFVETLRMEMQEDMYKSFKKLINSYPGGYAQFLTDKKEVLLSNYTTTYLAKHPVFRKGIEKRVNGEWTSPRLIKKENGTIEYRWADEKGNDLKIDRDNAAGRGLTSGPEFIRRNKKINDVLSTKEFVDYHFQDGGLRTKKKQNPEDAVARQLASEIALETFQSDLKAQGPLFKLFAERAELLGNIINDTTAIELAKDLDRGLIKESKKISENVNRIMVEGQDNADRFVNALTKLVGTNKMRREGEEYLRSVYFDNDEISTLSNLMQAKIKLVTMDPDLAARSLFVSNLFKDKTVGQTAKEAFKSMFSPIQNEVSLEAKPDVKELQKNRELIVASIKDKFNALKTKDEQKALDFIENFLKISRGLTYGANQSILENNRVMFNELIKGDPLLEAKFKIQTGVTKNYIKKKLPNGKLSSVKPTIRSGQMAKASDFKKIAKELLTTGNKVNKNFLSPTLQNRRAQEKRAKADMVEAIDFIKNNFFNKDTKGNISEEDLKTSFLLASSLFKSTAAIGRVAASANFMVKPEKISNLENYVFEHRPPVTNIVHPILKYFNGEISKPELKKVINEMSVILTPKDFDTIANSTFKTYTLKPELLKNVPKNLIPAVETAIASKVAKANLPAQIVDLNTGKITDSSEIANVIFKNLAEEAIIDTITESVSVKESMKLDERFNEIIEETTGIEAYKEFSAVVGRRRGAQANKFRLYIPPSAEDFLGLLYDLMGTGETGNAHKDFFMKTLVNPYTEGINKIMRTKNAIRREYKELIKMFPGVRKKLEQKIPSKDFTYDQAIRVYLWDQAGVKIPGLTERDQKKLVDLVKSDKEMKDFSRLLSSISRQENGWLDPSNHWDVDTILSDLNNTTEGSNRKDFLNEFVENSKEIFSDKNKNKLRAALGNNWVDALDDSLYRMTNGTNRAMGAGKIINAWNQWVNNATGAIMFFNRRSAVLQLLSTVNYINWSDNNPAKAAAAFANQKQYWTDFAMIFNSPMMKERRGGLQMEVSESEIANAAANSKNKAKSIMSYMLKIGFTPTQMADSFAIASGGSTFYRNRLNKYLEEKDADGNALYTEKEAQDKAFEDFSRVTNETQQSADPSLISQEQAGALGRLILAFQNTSQQYARLTKKAARDLVNKRGNWKENVSKIAYYMFIQNLVFNALQAGLFALIPGFEDEEEMTEAEKKKKATPEEKTLEIINGIGDTILKGSGLYGASISTIKNVIMKYYKAENSEKPMKDYKPVILEAASLSPPIGSKLRKLKQSMEGYNYNREVIKQRGFDVTYDGRLNLSPAWLSVGQVTSAATNIPLDRVYDETNSMIEAFDSRNTAWQRTALALGWKDWTVGAKNEENELIKASVKEERTKATKEKNKRVRKAKIRKSKAR
jgi:hypothetical protein